MFHELVFDNFRAFKKSNFWKFFFENFLDEFHDKL